MKKTARPTDAEVRARYAQVDAFVRARDAAKKPASAPEIFDRFSTEQQVQIDRLVRSGNFHDDDDVIETLAAAALFTLGLHPLADDSFCRLSETVFNEDGGGAAYDGITGIALNEARMAGEAWTKKQRNAEHPVAMKGRAA